MKKSFRIIAVICDAKARKVIDVEEGRDAQTAVDFSCKFQKKGS